MDHLIADIDEIGARVEREGHYNNKVYLGGVRVDNLSFEDLRDVIERLLRPPGCGDGEGRDE